MTHRPTSTFVHTDNSSLERAFFRLESMPRDGPKEKGQGCDAGSDQEADPNSSSYEELLDVRFSDREGAEWSRLGLPEENKDGVKFILM